MKYLLFFLCFTPISHFLAAQQIVMRESDNEGNFSFVKVRVKDSLVNRYTESYEVLDKSDYKFMTNWGTSGNDTLYWTNGENIYLCDLRKHEKSTLVCSNLYWILELFVRNNYLYVVYHPSKEQRVYDNRYKKGLKFCRIHIGTWEKEILNLPPTCNVTNLTISPDKKWASFVNTIIAKNIKYQLVLYNFLNGNVTIIDSADTKKPEWFGDDDKFNSAIWTNANKLTYYKHIDNKSNGEIVSFDIRLKIKQVVLKNFPERDFSWFGYYDGYFYFSPRHTLFKTKDGVKKEPVFIEENKMANILSAIVLPD